MTPEVTRREVVKAAVGAFAISCLATVATPRPDAPEAYYRVEGTEMKKVAVEDIKKGDVIAYISPEFIQVGEAYAVVKQPNGKLQVHVYPTGPFYHLDRSSPRAS